MSIFDYADDFVVDSWESYLYELYCEEHGEKILVGESDNENATEADGKED